MITEASKSLSPQQTGHHPEGFNDGLNANAIPMSEVKRLLVENPLLGMEGALAAEEVRYAYAEMHRELEGSKLPEDANTLELLRMVPPVSGIEIDNRKFYFSSILEPTGSNRKHAIGYTALEDGTIAPRLFYKSMSDGGWRVAPYYETYEDADGNQRGYYSKGDTMEYGYVRETRPYRAISEALMHMEATSRVSGVDTERVISHFDPAKLGRTNTYEDEAFELNIVGMKDLKAFKPGSGFESPDGRPAREILEEITIDPERQPDFGDSDGIVRTIKRRDPMMGEVTVDTYMSRDGNLEWNMAYAEDGSVWVNGITAPESNLRGIVTSYGTDDEVLAAGVLDNKPIEYATQVAGLEEGVDYDPIPGTRYVKLKVLDNLAPIKEFRAARGIVRKEAA